MKKINNKPNYQFNDNEYKESFITKIKKQEYISINLYEIIKKEHPEIIPSNFNLEKYNDNVIEKEYQKHKDYFNNMYKGIDDNIHLDKEQIKAILSDEDYSLILAGAGTGKTTTMASKVKYLVDIKKVEPSKIVVMSYTKKATEELEKRIVLDFGINARVTTFHSLGLMHIREIFKDRKCFIADDNLKEEIFLEYFKNNIFSHKYKIKELFEIFDSSKIHRGWLFARGFQENYEKYNTFDEYFENYKHRTLSKILTKDNPEYNGKLINIKLNDFEENKLKKYNDERIDKKINDSEIIRTIKGEIVKSKGEAIIANFLYRNSIEYQYEKIYPEYMPERRIYRPDFTLNLNGEDIYLEYFGLSMYKENELNRYNKEKSRKEEYHKLHHNKFIKLDYLPNEDIIYNLKKQLYQYGFELKPISELEIFNTMLENNKIAELYKFKQFLYDIIGTIKSSSKREFVQEIVDSYIKSLSQKDSSLEIISNEEQYTALRQYKYIIEFYNYYQSKLFNAENYIFDFADMIYYANEYINKIGKNNNLDFEYLIIDEYQDISEERYQLTKNIATRNSAKVVAVGDDWQSIFAFAGSKIEYTYNFLNYFKGAKILKINNTYRNSQQLIDYSGTFIMKNKDQIEKELVSSKKIINPIKFIPFDSSVDKDKEYQILKELILEIHKHNPEHNIMILARKNKIIEHCFEDSELKDEIGTKIEYVGYEDINIDGMSFHKSKGLTADEVILIGLDHKFPNNKNGYFWLEYLFKNLPQEENIAFAEERRLFYVALTRTKNYVYLLVNKDPTKRSPFINEIYNIIKEKNKN